MAPAAAASTARKRTRKRKRRQASSSESSDASSSGSDSETLAAKPKPTATKAPASEPSSASSSSSSSSSESSSDEEAEAPAPSKKAPSRSPSPVSGALPPFLAGPNESPEIREKREQELKDKFRKFWMGSVGDAFKDDLEQIRKEPNLTTSKLAILIDSLSSGADVFASRAGADVDEMELVLGHDS